MSDGNGTRMKTGLFFILMICMVFQGTAKGAQTDTLNIALSTLSSGHLRSVVVSPDELEPLIRSTRPEVLPVDITNGYDYTDALPEFYEFIADNNSGSSPKGS